MTANAKWYEFWGELQPMARSLCVVVPSEVSSQIGRIGQARVRVAVNGQEAQTLMLQGPNGSHFVKLSANFRKLAGVSTTQVISVRIALVDQDPPFEPPADLASALKQDPQAKAQWDLLPYRHKKGHVDYIDAAPQAQARERRIIKIIQALTG